MKELIIMRIFAVVLFVAGIATHQLSAQEPLPAPQASPAPSPAPAPGRAMMHVPAHRVRVREPAHKPRELPILPRPDHQMKMIPHHNIRQQPRRTQRQRLPHHLHKREIIPAL